MTPKTRRGLLSFSSLALRPNSLDPNVQAFVQLAQRVRQLPSEIQVDILQHCLSDNFVAYMKRQDSSFRVGFDNILASHKREQLNCSRLLAYDLRDETTDIFTPACLLHYLGDIKTGCDAKEYLKLGHWFNSF